MGRTVLCEIGANGGFRTRSSPDLCEKCAKSRPLSTSLRLSSENSFAPVDHEEPSDARVDGEAPCARRGAAVGPNVAIYPRCARWATPTRGGVASDDHTANELMSDLPAPSARRLLTINDLKILFRCGRTTAYERVHADDFPRPLALSGSAHRWWEHEVFEWLERQRVESPRPRADRGRQPALELDAPTAAPRPVELRRRGAGR